MRHPLEIEMEIRSQEIKCAKADCEFGEDSAQYAEAKEKLKALYDELDFAKSHGDASD